MTSEVRTIQLSRGLFATVDEADWELISPFKWFAHKGSKHDDFYADAKVPRHKQQLFGKRDIMMHQLILGFPGSRIDHRDGNGLNNTRANLRPCNASQNQQNRKLVPHSSRFKGVNRRTNGNTWQANIGIAGKATYLGAFKSELLAALAYDAAAILNFGEFARVNFPERARVVR